MNKNKYQWQGEPAKVEHGWCHVERNKEKPLWWYNYECRNDGSAVIPAIRVTQHNQQFCIANHYGIGVNKLLSGGWPNHCHFSLPIYSFETEAPVKLDEFDIEGYEKHEAERRLWEKENFPEEFERFEQLRKLAKQRV